jgi:formylglycine-generating enzyme required for sulfatase activity
MKKMSVFSELFMMFFIIVTSSCLNIDDSESTKYIRGKVLENGIGLQGVTVEMVLGNQKESVQTDSEGNYSFIVQFDGLYTLTFSRSRYIFDKSLVSIDMIGKSIQVELVTATPEDSTFIERDIRFIRVPGGSFQMGSNDGEIDEKPVHQVTVSGFWMGVYEITQAQYQTIMGSNPSYFTGDNSRPAEMVSWLNAVQFCNVLSTMAELQPCYDEMTWECDFSKDGYRLPTEAEWEYACRAGMTTQYCTGNNESDLSFAGWYVGNSQYTTHPVGMKEPNAWGLYDVHGNVWEWCHDQYGAYTNESTINPTGAEKTNKRIVRGGAWSDDPDECRSANRESYYQGMSYNLIGFRIVRR